MNVSILLEEKSVFNTYLSLTIVLFKVGFYKDNEWMSIASLYQ